ncbi:hypothetical protein Droror1_Dr00000856 [Drosera rotundifolia]
MGCRGANGGLKLEDTELRLGLPGSDGSEKESVFAIRGSKRGSQVGDSDHARGEGQSAPAAKAQVVGWPPIRSYRKNSIQQKKAEYVKVSMDGAPYLRKIDLNVYKGYQELLTSLEDMFKFTVGKYSERDGYCGSEFVPTYEDKDGDLMLVGDVPWEMFASSCKRLRIIKASDAKGLGCGV